MRQANRADRGVGLLANRIIITPAEHFGFGFQFGVDFQADDDVIVHVFILAHNFYFVILIRQTAEKNDNSLNDQ